MRGAHPPFAAGATGRSEMADDLTKRGPADGNRVNISEEWELRHWTAHFCCTQDELKAAVRAVGPMKDDVARYFRR